MNALNVARALIVAMYVVCHKRTKNMDDQKLKNLL